jgi:hypothetical protein
MEQVPGRGYVYRRHCRSHKQLRFSILGMLIFLSKACIDHAFQYLVSRWGNPRKLAESNPFVHPCPGLTSETCNLTSFPSDRQYPIYIITTSVLVACMHVFLIHRYFSLSRRWIITSCLSLVAVTSVVGSVLLTVKYVMLAGGAQTRVHLRTYITLAHDYVDTSNLGSQCYTQNLGGGLLWR